jgi:hypothetical protein
MTDESIINRWKRMAGSRSAKALSKDDLVGFFQAFRPYGQDIPTVLEGVAGADEIVPRLLRIYAATAPGWNEHDAYFLVRRPKPLSQDQVRDLVLAHIQRFAEIAQQIDAIELIEILERPPKVVVVQGQAPWPPGPESVETLMYEARADFMASLTPSVSEALLFDEALYYLACDYSLRDYVLWPLYRPSTTIVEPFGPYFEMWTHGVDLRFVGTDLIKAFVGVPTR